MLLDSKPHLFSRKASLFSIRLLRNCDFFMHKSNCATILKHTFYEDSRRLEERPLNIHMSQVNVDKQYRQDKYSALFDVKTKSLTC